MSNTRSPDPVRDARRFLAKCALVLLALFTCLFASCAGSVYKCRLAYPDAPTWVCLVSPDTPTRPAAQHARPTPPRPRPTTGGARG